METRTTTQAPEAIGGYELLLPIASGGMGTVFLAQREIVPGVLRKFAIKLLHPRFFAGDSVSAGDSVAEALMLEAQIAARVHSPHVVAVHEAGVDGGWLYLVMDYVDGDSLHALLRAARRQKERLPLAIVGRILVDALSGLHAAHEARDENGRPLGIIHRDFSPQNILVGADGVTRLTDFGIAKAVGQIGATATGVIKGKVSYMAPEQARGEAIDRRCDVWAAGTVAWEALAGRRLFKGANDAECLLRIVSGKTPPSVTSQRPDVSAEIAAVVSQALVPEKSARMGDAAELARAVEAAWGELAEPRAVALFLESLLGDQLEKRRQEAEQISVQRRAVQAATVQKASERAISAEAEVIAAPRRRGSWGFVAVATLLAAALGLGWYLGRKSPAPSLAAAPAPSDVPAPDVEPPPSASPVAAPAPRGHPAPRAPEPSAPADPVAASSAPPRAAPVVRTPPQSPPVPSTRAPDRLLGRD